MQSYGSFLSTLGILARFKSFFDSVGQECPTYFGEVICAAFRYGKELLAVYSAGQASLQFGLLQTLLNKLIPFIYETKHGIYHS